jgi:general secretion pathway protein M
MSKWSVLKARWGRLAPREKMLTAASAALVTAVLIWMVALGPALATLRTANEQHRVLDSQLRRMLGLQAQAQALKNQPKQNYEEGLHLLELSVQQRLGTTARLQVVGDRATITLSGTAPEALAQWLTQARVNARALPNEAHLRRNAAGFWEGTVIMTLPPR